MYAQLRESARNSITDLLEQWLYLDCASQSPGLLIKKARSWAHSGIPVQ